jgi:hypothetical protein
MLRSLAHLVARQAGAASSSYPTSMVSRRLAPHVSSVTRQQPWLQTRQPHPCRIGCVGQTCFHSTSSSTNNDGDSITSSGENVILGPPEKLTTEMAEGIALATKFYVRHGLSRQRLVALAADTETPVVQKWQRMMEIFLTTQVHVIAGLGYTADEQGLTLYAQALAKCIQEECDETMQELFAELRRDTWRELVATAFNLNAATDIPVLSIVDARNIMHKVSSKMMEPSVLLEIQTKTAKLDEGDSEEDYENFLANKHQILQDIIVNHVYMSGKPSLIEESGFGSGPKGYAAMQCAMSDYEGDPLISQYAAAAMVKVWDAAGLDISALQQD